MQFSTSIVVPMRGRKQQSKKEGCANIVKRPAGRFVAGLLFSGGEFASVSLFSRTLHPRMENENVSLPSAMSRARATFSDLSPFAQLFLALFLSIFLSFSFSLPPYLRSLRLSQCIPRFSPLPNIHVYTTYFSRINRRARVRMYQRRAERRERYIL